MFATSQVIPELALRPRPDRRADDRFAHTQHVQINGMPAVGRDISSRGIGIVTAAHLSIGEVVRVVMADTLEAPGPQTTTARVARVERRAGRQVVGLEFMR